MLATFGFTVTGILFIIFALTLPKLHKKTQDAQLKLYIKAYLLLAAAFLGYGIACLINTTASLSGSMILGNVLMLIATILLLSIQFQNSKYKKYVVYGGSIIGTVLIVIRMLYFYPEPYMQDSILVFNSQRFVSFILAAVFLLVWLPVNLAIANYITVAAKLHSITRSYVLLYAGATFSAIIFLLAKKPVTLALSFTAISVAFLILIVTNILVSSAHGGNHGRK